MKLIRGCHSKCPFPDKSGYNIVDIMDHNNIPFCEVGECCVSECPYSWTAGSGSETEKAAEAWCKEEKERLNKIDEEFFNSKQTA